VPALVPTPNSVLQVVSKARLAELGRDLSVGLPSSGTKEQQVERLIRASNVDLSGLGRLLTRDELKLACRAHGLDDSGRSRVTLPVSFSRPPRLNSAVAQLHLSHPFVQRIMSRFLSQGFSTHDLSRVTALRNPHDDEVIVFAFGRLSRGRCCSGGHGLPGSSGGVRRGGGVHGDRQRAKLDEAMGRLAAGRPGLKPVLSRFLLDAAMAEADRILAGKK
jgi:hypothetical protein